MKIIYNKDQFRLMETLTGDAICCETCRYWSSPGNKMCVEPLTYYDHVDKQGKFKLLSFCANYRRDLNG